MTALTPKRFLKTESHNIELLPRDFHGKTGGSRIGNCQTSAVVWDPVPIGDTNPSSRTIPSENDIIVKINS